MEFIYIVLCLCFFYFVISIYYESKSYFLKGIIIIMITMIPGHLLMPGNVYIYVFQMFSEILNYVDSRLVLWKYN